MGLGDGYDDTESSHEDCSHSEYDDEDIENEDDDEDQQDPNMSENSQYHKYLSRKNGLKTFDISYVPSRSLYRRRNYKFLKSEPKKVFFQIHIQSGSTTEKTSVFDVNVESLTCQRFFLDDAKELYVIC